MSTDFFPGPEVPDGYRCLLCKNKKRFDTKEELLEHASTVHMRKPEAKSG